MTNCKSKYKFVFAEHNTFVMQIRFAFVIIKKLLYVTPLSEATVANNINTETMLVLLLFMLTTSLQEQTTRGEVVW